MKESQISDALRESMNAVRLSPALRARALCAMLKIDMEGGKDA